MESDIAAAYLAGYFDGHGHLMALGKNGAVTIRIVIVTTSLDVVKVVDNLVPGGKTGKKEYINKTWRPQYIWHTSNAEVALKFLNMIRPYTVVKQKEVGLGRVLLTRIVGKVGIKLGRLTDSERKIRTDFQMEINAAKRR